MPKNPPPESLAEGWQVYAAFLVEAFPLSEADREPLMQHTQRAFYAGARVLFAMLQDTVQRTREDIGFRLIRNPVSLPQIEAIELEFRRFEQDVRHGRA